MAEQKFSELIAEAEKDRSGQVGAAHQAVQTQLAAVRRDGLTPLQTQSLDSIEQRLADTKSTFEASTVAHRQSLAPKIAEAKKFAQTVNFALAGGFALAVLLIFTKTGLGFLVLLVVIAGRFITKRSAAAKAAALVQESWGPARAALSELGDPETLTAPATGLLAEADALYLSALDPSVRGAEIQRRSTEKQMQVMQQQHQEAMSAQAAQLEALRAEQRATNDALHGRPGFVGQVLRGAEDAKRKKKS